MKMSSNSRIFQPLKSDLRGRIRRRCVFVATVVIALAGGTPAIAGPGDGPRSFPLLPKDIKLLTVYALSQSGNQLLDPGQTIPDAEIDAKIGIIQYTRSFSVNGRIAAAFVALPYASVQGGVPLGSGTVSTADTGFGSLILGGVLGIIGSPALSGRDFARHKPGFQLGVVGKLMLPTGTYDPDRIISIGSNRLVAQLVVPMTFSFGESMVDPNLTTIEILPSITVFGDNTKPSGGATVTGQKPLFSLEAHVTRNLGGKTWVSFGGIYNWGGETSTNGAWNNDPRESLGLGASVNFPLNASTSVKVSYGEIVWRNDTGMDGKLLRIITTFAF